MQDYTYIFINIRITILKNCWLYLINAQSWLGSTVGIYYEILYFFNLEMFYYCRICTIF